LAAAGRNVTFPAMKIVICLPVHGDTRALFTYKLARMIAVTHREWPYPQPPHVEVLMAESSSVAKNREWLSKEAEKAGAEWLLWLDSDQTFPGDTLLRLLAHGLPVVGANYPLRGNARPAARREVGGRMVSVWSTPDRIANGEVERVAFMGLGVCLVSAEALARLDRPYFAGENEDHYFFSKLRAAGIEPMLDHRLSGEIGHLNIQELTNDHSLAMLASQQRKVEVGGGGVVTGKLGD
jgi:hypothetical protein